MDGRGDIARHDRPIQYRVLGPRQCGWHRNGGFMRFPRRIVGVWAALAAVPAWASGCAAGADLADHVAADRDAAVWVDGPLVPYPDDHVRYYRYAFHLPAGVHTTLRITGQYPDARYAAFNLYDQSKRESLGGLSDEALLVDGLDVYRPPRFGETFTVWLTTDDVSGRRNAIALPRDDEAGHVYELWYRIYLPRQDIHGGVPVPTIEACDPATGALLPLPPAAQPMTVRPQTLRDWRKLPPKPGADGRIAFYAKLGHGDFNNGDNQYLAARLDFSRGREYAVLRFRAPTFGRPQEGSPRPDVRYFSFCIGGGRLASTTGSIADEEMRVSHDGDTFLLVGPSQSDGIDVASICRAKGVNFLPKGDAFIPVVIYRHVLPRQDFPGRVNRRFAWPYEHDDLDPGEAARRCAQHEFIGDWSPTGRHITLAEALAWLEDIGEGLRSSRQPPF